MEINKIYQGNSLEVLESFEDNSIDCVVTSPPYWGLRDYGTASWIGCNDINCDHKIPKTEFDPKNPECSSHVSRFNREKCFKCGAKRVDLQLGMESTPEEFISKLWRLFYEVKRVLKSEGTLWLNLGDSYYNNYGGGSSSCSTGNKEALKQKGRSNKPKHPNYKIKDLCGIPWKVAFMLQEPDYKCEHCSWVGKFNQVKIAVDTYCPICGNVIIKEDGWYLRQDIIWNKPNVMPESVKDRCTKSHEYIFLLTKNKKYYFDYKAIKEPATSSYKSSDFIPKSKKDSMIKGIKSSDLLLNEAPEADDLIKGTRNKRSVWNVSTKPFKESHFATFPEKLIAPCILAGCSENGKVLDPFFGAGTVGVVSKKLNRNYVGIELNPEYIKMAENRIKNDSK